MGAYKRIVVGTDGSPTSFMAVDRAAAVARDCHAVLVIATAYKPEPAEVIRAAGEALKDDEAFMVVGAAPAESMLRDAVSRAYAAGAREVETVAAEGEAVAVLDRVVRDYGADLVVVGNVGLNTITGRVLGSVPQKMARRAGIDVIIAHTS